MKAFILVAGQGTRIQPLTLDLPKPMLPVLNKPVLQHIVEHLVKQGVTSIMMNPGFCGDKIENYFGDGSQFGAEISYLPEMVDHGGEFDLRLRGSASTLAAAQYFYKFFDEPVIVICGDAIIDVDFKSAMHVHQQRNALVSVLLKSVPAQEAHKYGIAKLSESGVIQSFVEKPRISGDENCLANSGIYIFSPAAVDAIDALQGVDIGQHLIPRLVAETNKVLGQVPAFTWRDIGTLADYRHVNHALHHENYQSPRQCALAIGACCQFSPVLSQIRGKLMIGNGCVVQSDVSFSGSNIINHNVIIERGSKLDNCIIAPYCHVPAGSVLSNVILTREWLVTFNDDGQVVKSLQLNSGSSRHYLNQAALPTHRVVNA